jgi:hypothetical protein
VAAPAKPLTDEQLLGWLRLWREGIQPPAYVWDQIGLRLLALLEQSAPRAPRGRPPTALAMAAQMAAALIIDSNVEPTEARAVAFRQFEKRGVTRDRLRRAVNKLLRESGP